MSKESDRYEQVTRAILDACRKQLNYKEVRPKGKIPGESGTEWEIDAICYLVENNGMILVECRRHTTSTIDQEQVGGLIFRIIDTGAEGGLMVTPLGYQEGAKLVAKARKVTLATLNPDATEREYVLKVAERLFVGIEGKGGVVVGGSAGVSAHYAHQASGGIALGGAALVSVTKGSPSDQHTTQGNDSGIHKEGGPVEPAR